jgi:predicted metal-dependent hydrolase
VEPNYLAFFECFNRGLYFEAHEVLEEIWLPARGGEKDLFYKGLIQLAGAFVHITKERWQPARALLRLAEGNLAGYPEVYERLDLGEVRAEIREWLSRLGLANGAAKAALDGKAPRFTLRKA